VTPQHMRGNEPRSVPSVYPAQSTPLSQATMLFGGRPRRPTEMEALAACKRNDEKDRATQWIFYTSSIGRVGCSRDEFFEFIPMSLFEV